MSPCQQQIDAGPQESVAGHGESCEAFSAQAARTGAAGAHVVWQAREPRNALSEMGAGRNFQESENLN